MKPLKHFAHWPNTSDAERRLLAFAGETLPESAARIVAEWAKWGINFAKDIGVGIRDGLYDGWTADTRAEDLKIKEMQMISESLKLMPKTMRQLLEQNFQARKERLTLEQLVPLFQLDTWSRVFEDSSIFLAPVVPLTSLTGGPDALVRSLTIDQRKAMFFDFFQSLIPSEVGDIRGYVSDEAKEAVSVYHDIADGPDEDAQRNFLFADPNRLSRAQAAMGGVLGRSDMMPAPGDPAYILARTALHQHYWRDGVRSVGGAELPIQPEPIAMRIPGGTKLEAYGAKPRLFDDFAGAIRKGTRGSNMTEFGQSLNPSLLKGAIAMGAINQSDIRDIETVLAKRDTETSKRVVNARTEYADLTGVIRAEKTRESMDFAKIFSSMSGFEKLALIGASIYLMTQMPGLTAAGAVMYFGSKFLLKQKDPINETFAPMVQQGTKMANDALESVTGGRIKIGKDEFDSADALRRVDMMQQFLSKNAQTDLETTVTGFSILGDMNLRELSPALVLGSDDGKPLLATLNTKSESFNRLRDRLRQKGLKPSAQQFFFDGPMVRLNDPEIRRRVNTDKMNTHLLDAGNALMVVYYLVAARKAENRDMVQRLEKLRGDNDGRYESLPLGAVEVDGVIINPREEFLKLVRQGMGDPPDATLAQFVQEHLQKDASIRPRVDPTPPAPRTATTPAAPRPRTPVRPATRTGTPPMRPGVAPAVPPRRPGASVGVAPATPGVAPGVVPSSPSVSSGSPAITPGVAPGVPPTGPAARTGGAPVVPAARPGSAPSAPAAPSGRPPVTPPASPSAGPSVSPSSGATPAIRPGSTSSGSPANTPGA